MLVSPCTGVCKLDATTGWCFGCGRSGAEMDGWSVRPEAVRQQIWDEIPDRLLQLGVTCRRLPWTTEDIRAFVTTSLETARGTWAMGVVGAVAEFSAATGAQSHVRQVGETIDAWTMNGAIRLRINDDVRALTFDPQDWGHEPRIVLAVKRERGRLPLARGVTDLGTDVNALSDETAATTLFDLGLGRKEASFCVRVAQGAARDTLERVKGLRFDEALPAIGAPLVAESPTRVVRSALGRVEVQGRIPPPDARSPDGPRTHLLPDHLATGRALPVGMDLPRAYLPGAIFYPKQ